MIPSVSFAIPLLQKNKNLLLNKKSEAYAPYMSKEDENGLKFKSEEQRRSFYSKWSVGETCSEEHRLEKEYDNVRSLILARRKIRAKGKDE